jgi:chemotaxis protein MotB
MRRKKKHQEHDNLERWMVSYADFVTLLFAFFVVMYAISSVNEGKYRVLSDTLMSAFNGPPKSLQPIQVGDDGLDGKPSVVEPDKARPGQPEQQLDPLTQVAKDFEKVMLPFIQDEMVRVRREEFWVELELNTNFMFASGSSDLEDEALPVLKRVAGVLGKYPNHVQVEGFTDNVPINTYLFPSNWELSAARAASVVHVFMKDGVKPDRMSAVGFGEYRPVADNATSEGRRRNRRVLVVVLADADARRAIDLERNRLAQ